MIKYVFTNLPKISLNEWYSGKHWTQRKKMKDVYKLIISPQVQPIEFPCSVAYFFEFRVRPLDQSNAIAMVKMIEDVMFPEDNPDIVKDLYIKSFRSPRSKELKKKNIEVVTTVIIKPHEE